MIEDAKTENKNPQLEIQRIYLKDLSLEVPNAPEIFREEWKPELSVNLDVVTKDLESGLHEVLLSVTVTAKVKEKVIFLVEAHQAGIFLFEGFQEEQTRHALNVYCPSILFPYIREAVSSAVTKASFPPVYLSPVNFDFLYAQRQSQEKAQ
ncbi:MAG: protein-export chaperone SecB [Pseudomonadota bacterium]|nr:protein-export chaperone SecB [Gammaproteobacteria bacterium]MBU1558649.1 protein-export chaperone SecB [Gammaproteobacteria bacterium]MBU1926837.1 protein-export chaperone SecB [Gammaproteobacteria bacterium]MBU2546166.1 protein-export chaperone SecB [Gammaproteobacteria bacterium]